MSLEDAKQGLKMLKEAGMVKINFSGGEPFLKAKFLGRLVNYCKYELGLKSVSIVSNGSLIKDKWFEQYGEALDILAISCDSFDEDVNRRIGRGTRSENRKTSHIESLRRVRDLCGTYKVAFKLNTVVNTENYQEDFTAAIQELKPIRWKCFQCLLIDGENSGADALRDARSLIISSDQFDEFVKRHAHIEQLVPECNASMRDSYLILDEYMRFLDCTEGGKKPSKSILDVGVANALDDSGFDVEMFIERGGVYQWSKGKMDPASLEW